MSQTFVNPAQVLPRWMSQPAGALQCGDQLFDGLDAGGIGLSVPHFGDGGAWDAGSIGQQYTFLPGHANQCSLDSFKVHQQSPLVDSLTEDGYADNRKTARIRIKDGVSIPRMHTRTPSRIVLAANINRLMGSTLSLDSNTKMARITTLGLGTVGRVRNAEVDATIDTLDKLAYAFRIEPWQLLAPQGASQSQQSQLPLEDVRPVAPEAPQSDLSLSERGWEIGLLFDLLTASDGKIDKAEVFAAATEAMSRIVTGRHARPTGMPSRLAQAEKRAA